MKHKNQPSGLWRRVMLAALFGVFALAAYAALTYTGNRVVALVVEIQPTADGLFLIQAKDIEKRLDSGPQGALIGQAVKDVSFDHLERFLEEDPFVKEADLYTSYDGKLHVEISQNQPVLRVHHRGGSDYYLGSYGEVLPLSKHDVARVPVLTGDVPSFVEAASDSVAIKAFVLADLIQKDDLLRPLIEQIEQRKGSFVMVPKLGTATITVGSLDQLEEKISRLKTYFRGAAPEAGWEAYSDIDLSYKGQVVCRKKKRKSKARA